MPPPAYARAISLPEKTYSGHIRELQYRIEQAHERMEANSLGSAPAQRPPHRRRAPLGDGSASANIVSPQRNEKKEKFTEAKEHPPSKTDYQVAPETAPPVASANAPKNKRLSQISGDAATDSKRSSVISTASTTASGTPRKRKTHIGPWQLGSTVGKGGTAHVRKVRHVHTGQTAVAKIIPVAAAERARAVSLANLVDCAAHGDPTLDFGKAIPLGLEREIAIMKLLRHPNIVRLYDVWENRKEIYMIMEFVPGGELFDYVATETRLDEDVTVFLFRQIIGALRYCHSLSIHHRDLKPENILLDFENMTVKLVDFGMAALQPAGNFLTTPCGSPHYAAPELLSNRPYDGSQADVWSVGVVLYVMLCGYPPFNYPQDLNGSLTDHDKLKLLFAAIGRAEYHLPGHISPEARDLIRSIFVPDPTQRLTIDEVWHHPFVHKYDSIFNDVIPAPSNSMAELLNAREKWVPLSAEAIDRDIFRALRTLWHSESDTVLTERLCNAHFNDEKFFYHTMLLYRKENDQQLEAGQGSFRCSASDYQHAKKRPKLASKPSSRKASSAHVGSSFSISASQHLVSKHSYYDLAASEASYDPFRASPSPPVISTQSGPSVTVRQAPKDGKKHGGSRASRGSSLRVDVLRAHNRRGSRVSSKNSSAGTSVRRGTAGKNSSRSSSSKLSLGSSQFLNGSPMPVMRPSELHKRGVQFSHSRKGSTGSALASVDEVDSATRAADHRAKALRRLAARSNHNLSCSPPGVASLVVRPKRGTAAAQQQRMLRQNADIEARKVSVELGKVCDEAFNFRSSVSSSFMSEKPFLDTPPSSISRPSASGLAKDPFFAGDSVRNRPLPPTPRGTRSSLYQSETPASYTARELAEMRDRLASKYARETGGSSNQQYFNDVLKQLDTLMKPIEQRLSASDGRRIVSAPADYHHLSVSVDLNPLDVIPEEDRSSGANEKSKRSNGGGFSRRSVMRGSVGTELPDATIRVVAPSPPHIARSVTSKPWTPAPLNIRKSSTSTRSSSSSKTDKMSGERHNQYIRGLVHPGQLMPYGRDEQDDDHLVRLPAADLENFLRATTRSALDDGGNQARAGPSTGSSRHRDSFAPDWQYGSPTTRQRGASVVERESANLQPGGLHTITEGSSDSDERRMVGLNGHATTGALDGLDDRTTRRDARLHASEQAGNRPNLDRALPELPKKKGLVAKIRSLFGKKPATDASPAEDDPYATALNYPIGNQSPTLRGPFSDEPRHGPFQGLSRLPTHAELQHQVNLAAIRADANQADISEKNVIRFLQGFANKYRNVPGVSRLKPAIEVVVVTVPRNVAWKRFRKRINDAEDYEIKESDKPSYTMKVKFPARAHESLKRDVYMIVEMFAIEQNGVPVSRTILRLVQQGGTLQNFEIACLLITGQVEHERILLTNEAERANIVAALFEGLQPPTAVYDDDDSDDE